MDVFAAAVDFIGAIALRVMAPPGRLRGVTPDHTKRSIVVDDGSPEWHYYVAGGPATSLAFKGGSEDEGPAKLILLSFLL